MEFLNSITAGERVNGEISKVFRLLWNRARDVFYISDLNIRSNGVVTREALHHIAKIFDPLGLLYFMERCLYKNCGFLSNHGINHYQLKVGIT